MDINPMELFQQEAPEVAGAFNNLIQALVASRGLDQKTKQLIYIAMKASLLESDMAVRCDKEEWSMPFLWPSACLPEAVSVENKDLRKEEELVNRPFFCTL